MSSNDLGLALTMLIVQLHTGKLQIITMLVSQDLSRTVSGGMYQPV